MDIITQTSKTLIRVFPRRTSMTPIDIYAFIGDPPLIRPEADEVHISVTFTWDIEEGQRLRNAWGQYYPVVKIGGPALSSPALDFTPGLYLKAGVVITSRGCNKRCKWCLVPGREGNIRLLPIAEGHIIQDNNLLQCPRRHLQKVFAMLRKQRERVVFIGGIDATLVDNWVAEQFAALRIDQLFMAADTRAALRPLQRAVEKLDVLRSGVRRRLRSYVLIGFSGETPAQATERLEAVWEIGCMPFAQLYQPPDGFITYNKEWKALARKWSRPAAMVTMMKGKGNG